MLFVRVGGWPLKGQELIRQRSAELRKQGCTLLPLVVLPKSIPKGSFSPNLRGPILTK